MSKMCNRCNTEKPLTEFYSYKGRIHNQCKSCECERSKQKRIIRNKDRLCVECGRPSPEFKRCEECRSKKQINVKERREYLKVKAIEYLGGKCELCGHHFTFQDAYDFHHIGCDVKKFEIGYRLGKSNVGWMTLKAELDKCLLLCAICHRWIHYQERQSASS